MNSQTPNSGGKKIYIRYMASLRCKMIARSAMEDLDINHSVTVHGAIQFTDECTQEQFNLLDKKLRKHGMALLDELHSSIIDKIINEIIEVIHHSDELPKYTYTDIIAEKIGDANISVLKIFSDVQGISVLHFIILQKIERIKEMLIYDDLSLSEIAEKLRYKNENYLTAQFKKYTGLSPDYFKELKKHRESSREQTHPAKTIASKPYPAERISNHKSPGGSSYLSN